MPAARGLDNRVPIEEGKDHPHENISQRNGSRRSWNSTVTAASTWHTPGPLMFLQPAVMKRDSRKLAESFRQQDRKTIAQGKILLSARDVRTYGLIRGLDISMFFKLKKLAHCKIIYLNLSYFFLGLVTPSCY
jgi:hypothetical protein